MSDAILSSEDEEAYLRGAEQIGPNEWIRRIVSSSGALIGLTEIHRKPDGVFCQGFIKFDTPESREWSAGPPYWDLNSLDPLDISPSLLCRICGNHGFIKQGKWASV